MKPVFLDASGLIAVANTDDQWHDRAERAWRELMRLNTPLVTTSLVLFELGDGLSQIDQRLLAVALYDRLRHSPRVQIVSASPEQEAAAWYLFRDRPDKTWGATDCASFVVMNQLGIEAALTVDHHFEQAGFQRLIGP
jgi:predicted nucleic acid-binding protein